MSTLGRHEWGRNRLLPCFVIYMLKEIYRKNIVLSISYTNQYLSLWVQDGYKLTKIQLSGRFKGTVSHYCACTKLWFSDSVLQIRKMCKRTLKNPIASCLVKFDAILKLLRIRDPWYIFPIKFQNLLIQTISNDL